MFMVLILFLVNLLLMLLLNPHLKHILFIAKQHFVRVNESCDRSMGNTLWWSLIMLLVFLLNSIFLRVQGTLIMEYLKVILVDLLDI